MKRHIILISLVLIQVAGFAQQQKIVWGSPLTYPFVDPINPFSLTHYLKDSIFASISPFMLALPDSVYKIYLVPADKDDPKLTALPADLYKFKNLQQLYINGNNLSDLPDSFTIFKNLKLLVLSFNPIHTIPKVLLKMPQLESFVYEGINEYKLNNLPDDFVKLKNLKYLDLSRNNFTSFPPQLFKLTNLYVLNLDGNHITEVPKQIKSLKKLTGFFINYNFTHILPKEIGELINLQRLGLMGADVFPLPSTLYKIENLHVSIFNGDANEEQIEEIKKKTKGWKIYVH